MPIAGTTAQAQTFDDLGYRYAFDVFPTADHFALAGNDSYQPAADFLGTSGWSATRPTSATSSTRRWTSASAKRSPTTPTGSRACGCETRAATAPLGEVDAVSHGFGVTDPEPGPTETGAARLPPGNLGTFAYTERSRAWGEPGSEPKRDGLDARRPRTCAR